MAESNLQLGDTADAALPTEAAYKALLPEILALDDDDLPAINIDVVAAVTTALGVAPALKALRGEIAAELSRFDLARFDKLERYALALSHANTLHRGTLPNRTNVADLGEELSGVRDRLLATASALAGYDLINVQRLADIKKVPGYRALAADVLALVAVFKEHWPRVENKSPVTLAALNDAGNRAVELLAAVGLRDQAPLTTGEAARLRQKAFTLFVRTYDDARRAVLFLRPEPGAADDIAPSLYAGRGGSRRRAAEGSASEDSPPPTPSNGEQVSDSGTVTVDNSAGLPLTKPFTT